MAETRTVADFTARLPTGEAVDLADKKGKVLLIVNTASKCGFTPQYKGLEALHQKYGGAAPSRVGLNHPSIAPYGAYEIGDGSQVVLSIQNPREWISFCELVLLQPDVATQKPFSSNEARVQNRTALNQIIHLVFSKLNQDELVNRLQQAKVAFGLLNTVADLLQHPQLRTAKVKTPGGEIELVASAIRRSGSNSAEQNSAEQVRDQFDPVPEIGQHSDAIRAEFQKP